MNEKEELESSAAAARREAEFLMARSAFNAVLKSSPIIDKVVTSFLAGIGATLALVVANLEQTSLFIGSQATKQTLLWLLIAGLLSILEKVVAVRIRSQVGIEQRIRTDFPAILREYLDKVRELREQARAQRIEIQTSDPDFMQVLNEIATVVPWYQRRHFTNMLRKSLADRLYGFRISGRMFNRQVIYALLVLLTVTGIVINVALSVNIT